MIPFFNQSQFPAEVIVEPLLSMLHLTVFNLQNGIKLRMFEVRSPQQQLCMGENFEMCR